MTQQQVSARRGLRPKTVPLVLGPLLAVAIFLLLGTADLSTEGRAVIAVIVLMGTWWIGEALPIGVTSLVPIVAFPFVGAMSIDDATAPYASHVIFLFLGGFVLALTIQSTGLDRRLAVTALAIFGATPGKIIAGLMVSTGLITLVVSNGATVMIMLPITFAVIDLVSPQIKGSQRTFAVSALISIAYAATVGGLASLVATPVNLIVAGYISENAGVEINFVTWFLMASPMSLVMMVLTWLLITKVLFRVEFEDESEVKRLLGQQRSELGKLTPDEMWCLGALGLACLGWIVIPLVLPDLPITDSMVAVIVAIVIFIMPSTDGQRLLKWDQTKELPWSILLLIGAGFSISAAVTSTDLGDWLANFFQGIGGLPTLLVLSTIVLILAIVTEFTSSVAMAAAFVPIIGGIAASLGFDTAVLVIATGFACLMAFALPVAATTNAVIFASGKVSTRDLFRAGVPMTLIGVICTIILCTTLVPLVVGG